ncbi:MAG: hypothetical protein HYS86_02220 [Candidatus Chisholmbacteria bacterium]|nr:hypothetical protein [Candidatus Chisholmbacteria bacterium]
MKEPFNPGWQGIPDPEPEQKKDILIEIGTSLYPLSPQTQKYVGLATKSEYEHNSSVLIINEPHFDVTGQFAVYKLLETFFTETPQLVSETTFLAEGLPVNQTLSLAPLVDAIPNPDEDTIWEVLSTFLIPGYAAYAWKFNPHLPIVGTEDPSLYQLSRDMWANMPANPSAQELALWNVSVAARNRQIAKTLIEHTQRLQNPILFIGDAHLLGLSKVVGRQDAKMPLDIYDFLKEEKVGHTFLSTTSSKRRTRQNVETYRRLMLAQQSGKYEDYISLMLTGERETTVTPSPENAAEYLKLILGKRQGSPGETHPSPSKAFSLQRENRFIDAAQEYSALSATKPGVPGYIISVQESLLRDVTSKILRAKKGPGSKQGPPEPNLPLFGPRIAKDHYHRVSQFATQFSKTPGHQETINNAMSPQWETRYGGALVIAAAEEIGQARIRAFEARHTLPNGRINRVDIATTNNIAVECKNAASWVPRSRINKWVEQAITRLKQSRENYHYSATVIVVPQQQNAEKIQTEVDTYLRLKHPHLLRKIRVCRVNELNQLLRQYR